MAGETPRQIQSAKANHIEIHVFGQRAGFKELYAVWAKNFEFRQRWLVETEQWPLPTTSLEEMPFGQF